MCVLRRKMGSSSRWRTHPKAVRAPEVHPDTLARQVARIFGPVLKAPSEGNVAVQALRTVLKDFLAYGARSVHPAPANRCTKNAMEPFAGI